MVYTDDKRRPNSVKFGRFLSLTEAENFSIVMQSIISLFVFYIYAILILFFYIINLLHGHGKGQVLPSPFTSTSLFSLAANSKTYLHRVMHRVPRGAHRYTF